MEAFSQKKNASEKKYVLEAQQEFKAEARRNKKLAHWVSELLGKSEEETKKYVVEVIAADMQEAGDDDVFRKVRADIDAAGGELTDVALRSKMDSFMEESRGEIIKESE